MSLEISRHNLDIFLKDLLTEWPVYGPTKEETAVISGFRFKRLSSPKELELSYPPTIIPPKKYLMPAREEILRFEGDEIFPPDTKESIIFGLSKKDGEGIFYLDKLMLTPISEEHYHKRREKIKLVIVDHLPPSNNLNCDLYLQLISDEEYLVFTYSEFGQKITKKKYFGHNAKFGEVSTKHLEDEIIFHPLLDKIVEGSKEHPIWEKLSQECFNCGICSYTCPLCYCFEIEDKIDLTKKSAGKRERVWDSCMLPDFNKVTFHNFRPDQKDRIYNWYYHKFVRMPREYGFPGCVDCGRCIEFCPANINFREVLKELIHDHRS